MKESRRLHFQSMSMLIKKYFLNTFSSSYMKLLILCFVLIFFFQFSNAKTSLLHKPNDQNKHFVFVHGAGHGAWCWYKLITFIKSSGHNVTAIDLAASGINPNKPIDVPKISDYFKPLMDFMGSLSEESKVVLVGHSFGGFAVSQAMEKFSKKISVAVFVSAAMLGPTFNVSTYNKEFHGPKYPSLDNQYSYDNGPDNPPTTFIYGPKFLAAYLYQLSPLEDFTLATTLVRPLYLYGIEDMLKEIILTKKNYGSINRVYIIPNEDKVFPREVQEWLIRRNPPDEVKVIEGSDHMAMLSKPVELFDHLMDIASKYYSY